MSETETATRTLLFEWSQAQAKLVEIRPIIENEMRLRKLVMEEYFPAPVEGVNTCQLESGWELKGIYKISRGIDAAVLPAVGAELRGIGVSVDTLVRNKPELNTAAYRALVQINPDAAKILDKALISKPVAPSIEIRPPKARA